MLTPEQDANTEMSAIAKGITQSEWVLETLPGLIATRERASGRYSQVAYRTHLVGRHCRGAGGSGNAHHHVHGRSARGDRSGRTEVARRAGRKACRARKAHRSIEGTAHRLDGQVVGSRGLPRCNGLASRG